MNTIKQKVYLDDSDDYIIVTKETETSKEKQKDNRKFNLIPVRDFITTVNRRKFGHICNRCSNKSHCDYWKGKIILSCNKK